MSPAEAAHARRSRAAGAARAEPRWRSLEVAEPAEVVEAVEPAPRRWRVRRPGWKVGTIAGILLFVALFAVAGFQAMMIQQQARIDDLNAKIATQQSQAQKLHEQVVELESPQRIIAAAQAAGMQQPAVQGYVRPQADDDQKAAQLPTSGGGR